ncbi:MAG: heme-dependent peroxidase [Actinomycetota bacterium]|nr:heme-dependent peroxidase [Actinomycetota bacterium]
MDAPETLEGWFALHDFRLVDWGAWNAASEAEREKAVAEAADQIGSFERVEDAAEGASATYRVVGHKADLLLFHLRPGVEELLELEQRFNQLALAAFSTRPYSYLSVVELSRHGAPEGAAESIEQSPYVQARLKPQLPEHDGHICFYPMDKKRTAEENWYTLAASERGALMRSHGRIGRTFTDRVTQIVTGSMGLDDWEWGVTLFSDDPLVFKKLVYEMRFDEVSARYALFGPFFLGARLPPGRLAAYLGT